MIQIIDDRSQIASTIESLRETIIDAGAETRQAQMGHQGGLIETDVHWLPEHDLWAAFRDRGSRYWNAFGIGAPFDEQSLSMIVQVNPPKDGIDRRTGGAFGHDDAGSIYVLHRGKIGGGRKGIGKNAFLSFFAGTGPIRPTSDGDQESPLIVIGALDDSTFIPALGAFVHQVARFKRLVTGDGPLREDSVSDLGLSFSPEYVGQKEVSARESIVADCRHGIVVNELRRRLEADGFTAVNDQFRDVYLVDGENRMAVLFEVKPSSSRGSLYKAVGQLVLNAPASPACIRVAVVPDDLPTDLKQRLERREIRTVTFEWKDDTPVFQGLGSVLPG